MNTLATRSVSTAILATCLVACGGGGGDNGTTVLNDNLVSGSSISSDNGSVAIVESSQASPIFQPGSETEPQQVPEDVPTDNPTSPPVSQTQVSYTASTALIANPERGFYNQVDCNNAINATQLKNYRTNQADSLTMCVFRLDDFANAPISQSRLDFFQSQMDAVRNAGAKVIVRFAYNFSDNAVDASPAMVNTHLDQLAPYLARNKDVITVVQAGFIGSWGEWANSRSFGVAGSLSTQNWNDRKALVNKLLQAVPAERMVQLRTPDFKRRIFDTNALTSAEAFNGSGKARVGHHNDCFLASSSDWGTYANTSVEYPYLEAETKYLAMGGETCNYAPPRSDCPTALTELAKFHWSYLNAGFHQTVLNNFNSQGCYNEIKQKLGYRFVLEKGSYANSGKPGDSFAVNFTVRNQGWAAPYNSRDVELVLRNTATGAVYRLKLNTDPRQWLPGQSITVSQTVMLPADMPKGNYAVLLNLPDPMASLRNRAEYAIQLANTNTWEASTGFNNLNHTAAVAP